jgi:RNase adaptor protein for sRNA GlmZ degradation
MSEPAANGACKPAAGAPGVLDVRVVTGLSGSGKSTALRVLEDLGWFCVDNLPTLLVGDLVRICADRGDVRGLALGIDAREKGFLPDFPRALEALRAAGHRVEVLFLDARFLPNPFFVERLQLLPGTAPQVAEFVTDGTEAKWFLDTIVAMLTRLVPQYLRDGRTYLTVAIGCTGGRHRSVALAEALARRLPVQPVEVRHRDVDRGGAEGGG